ncbi:hypothetical protein KC909_03525 [Candidatus Dojkabacteria bacterium]|uniref:Uncharacterized protein n=1 Tax=Candidatus Dojkabacteria bacterium TaxID=2099670 RepID=A0A955L5S0_9BACT|nr:hypothetical protein [Candidatus Dojkabacteria bacterium]
MSKQVRNPQIYKSYGRLNVGDQIEFNGRLKRIRKIQDHPMQVESLQITFWGGGTLIMAKSMSYTYGQEKIKQSAPVHSQSDVQTHVEFDKIRFWLGIILIGLGLIGMGLIYVYTYHPVIWTMIFG